MDTATLVIVEWEDSRQPSGEWKRLLQFKPEGICECVSVGFLLYDGEDYKTIAPNMADISSDENMQASGLIHIPTACITKISPLEEITSSLSTSHPTRASGTEQRPPRS